MTTRSQRATRTWCCWIRLPDARPVATGNQVRSQADKLELERMVPSLYDMMHGVATEKTSFGEASREEKAPAMTPQDSEPVPADIDLEIRVIVDEVDGRSALRYVLHSPNRAVDYHYREIPGHAIVGSPEAFHATLLKQMEEIEAGFDLDGGMLVLSEITDRILDLGRELHSQLFPREMRAAYWRFRDRATTLQITSDEPWIPWGLVRPRNLFVPLRTQLRRDRTPGLPRRLGQGAGPSELARLPRRRPPERTSGAWILPGTAWSTAAGITLRPATTLTGPARAQTLRRA